MRLLQNSLLAVLLLTISLTTPAAEPVPDKLVVLTFDDSVVSHATIVAPLLKKFGFGGTFFITEGFEFLKDKQHYMTWEQIKSLHTDGFEIGNHTRSHAAVNGLDAARLSAELKHIEDQCAANGIPKPVSFCYPGYQTSPAAVTILRERGYLFARAGGAQPFDPAKDEPLLMPQAFDSKPACTFEQFTQAIAAAKDGKIAVITFHGVPDIKHPWVHTDPKVFEKYLQHLKDEKCTVIAVKDMAKYLKK